MPMVRSVLGKSRTDLRGAWYEWKQECKRRRDRGDFSAHHNLDVLCGVCPCVYLSDYNLYYTVIPVGFVW